MGEVKLLSFIFIALQVAPIFGTILSKNFLKTLDCNGHSACALDKTDLNFEARSNIHCAMRCLMNSMCINFNYLVNDSSCQLFITSPYKLLAEKVCTNYDVIPRIIEPSQMLKNLAVYKRTCQSSTFVLGNSSWFAVDNLNITTFCTHTNDNDSGNNWFMVDLLDYVAISYVRILARSSNPSLVVRYKNLTVGVTNSSWLVQIPIRKTYPLCGVYLGPPVAAVWFQINCTNSVPPARYVIVHQVPVYSIDGGYLSLCEFQVFGTF